MFDFKNLTDSYLISVQHILPDDEVVSYSGKVDIEAKRIEKNRYRFVLQKRHNVQVNEGELLYGSDMMMKEIGDSLYPLKLSVSSARNILDIENFEEVKLRWTEKRAELLEKYRTFEFEQYLKASAHNMDNKQRFFKVLQRDAFIQFYFLPFEKNIAEFNLFHFPEYGYKMTYYAVNTKKAAKDDYIVHPAFAKVKVIKTDGTLLYQQSKEGDISDMQLLINMLMDDQSYHRRKISICRDENSERSVNLWIF